MAKRKYRLPKTELKIIERYILRAGGTSAWRAAQSSLIELVIGKIGKPLSDIRDDDLLKLRDTIKGSAYKPNYQRRLIYAMVKFFSWYWKEKGITTNDLSTIKLPGIQWKTKNSKDLLSPKDVETILKAARNARDRAFIAMLWDGSNRPVELLNLTWGELKADQYGYSFTTSAKTGKERHIRLTISIPYIEAYRREYPGTPEGDNPVFVTLRKIGGKYKQWTMDAAQFMIQELRVSTGIKNLKPGTFRPSRITADVKAGYELPYIMKKNWGNLKTPMIDVYTHTEEDYVDQIALRRAGMQRTKILKEAKQYEIEPPVCPVCQTMNPLGSMFCARCQTPLTEEAKKKTASMEDMITELYQKYQEEKKHGK